MAGSQPPPLHILRDINLLLLAKATRGYCADMQDRSHLDEKDSGRMPKLKDVRRLGYRFNARDHRSRCAIIIPLSFSRSTTVSTVMLTSFTWLWLRLGLLLGIIDVVVIGEAVSMSCVRKLLVNCDSWMDTMFPELFSRMMSRALSDVRYELT